MRLRDANEDGNALVLRSLRESEHDLLLYLAIDGRILRERIETGRRRIAGGLTEPEHGLLPGFARAVLVLRQPNERRPNDRTVGHRRGEDRIAPCPPRELRGKRHQIVRGFFRRHGSQVGDAGPRRTPPSADDEAKGHDLAVALVEHEASGTVVARVVPFDVARPIVIAPLLAPVVAAADAAAAPADFGLRREAHSNRPVAGTRDALGDRLRAGERRGRAREHQRGKKLSRHFEILSSRYFAARGSRLWPSQNVAFARISRSGSFLATS